MRTNGMATAATEIAFDSEDTKGAEAEMTGRFAVTDGYVQVAEERRETEALPLEEFVDFSNARHAMNEERAEDFLGNTAFEVHF